MNRIERINEKTYRLITEDNREFTCGIWYEKKTDAWHVIVPKEAREICGRTYIRVSKVGDNGYEFETKTEHRTGLSGGGWKSKMTPEEAAEYEICERKMEAIKAAAMAREISEADKLRAEIAKLQARLEGLQK